MTKFYLLLLNVFLLCSAARAQKKNDAYTVRISRATSPIRVDGLADEPAWQAAEVATAFRMVLPMDTSAARLRTDVRLAYDDQQLYVVAVCYYPAGQPYIVESLRRDWNFGRNDNFIFFMDTFDDQTNGFTFGANAAGAQWDGLLFEGGRANLSWDNKWTSAVRNYGDHYVFEAAIPFKTIRYKRGITRWGINFSRQDLTSTEKSAWAPVPRQFPTASLAYTGTLVWDQPPPAPRSNVSLIPYVLGGLTRDYVAKQPTDFRRTAGLDAKVAVTPALNLDLTVNPDFSQVDVDRQVTNLDRFELFFPERRQFFLENGDLFTNFGYGTIRPFFSRRIGLGVPIQFGARLSGKLDKDWRIGVMDMQTGATANGPGGLALPRQNFMVAALQRRVFARSNVGVLFVNKQSLADPLPADQPAVSRYNRNLGVEYNLASSNNLWTGKLLYLKSFSPPNQLNGANVANNAGTNVVAGNLQYASRRWLVGGQYESVGENYNPEVGFVPRRGYQRLNGTVGYTFLPTGGRVLSHGPTFFTTWFMNQALSRRLDSETYVAYNVTFRDRSLFTGWVATDYVRLLAPLDPTNMGKERLATGTEHSWRAWGTEYVSRPQSLFTYAFSSRYGGFYDRGTRLNLSSELAYRFQPYVSVAVSSSYNRIDLPNLSGLTQFWLVGPRLDVTMTNTLFITAFMQYNEQARNTNLNARLQWRYKPASDLFIVYTDNYLPGDFRVKNRALVLKLTYWWNV